MGGRRRRDWSGSGAMLACVWWRCRSFLAGACWAKGVEGWSSLSLLEQGRQGAELNELGGAAGASWLEFAGTKGLLQEATGPWHVGC
jgi:hypothetical protein